MSFFSKAASFAKTAAKTAVDTSKKVYSDLSARPTTVKCGTPECGTIVAIPAAVWAWSCVGCATHNADGAKCEACGADRPAESTKPSVTCEKCMKQTDIPSTVAGSYANTAVVVVKQAASDTAEYTKKTYNEMKARPEMIMCTNKECRAVLSVPLQLWAWTCLDGHANPPGVDACATAGCSHKRVANPVVACPHCATQIKVPSTVAGVKVQTAADATKKAAQDAATTAKDTYTHYTSKPEQFNCLKCNAKLMVPPPQMWMCQTAGCGTENPPDIASCTACKQKVKPKVMCGVCNQITDIPESNFMNSVKSTTLSAQKGLQDAKKTAKFLSENKEEIKAAGKFAKDNPELAKMAAGAASTPK